MSIQASDVTALCDLVNRIWFDIDFHHGSAVHTFFREHGVLDFDGKELVGTNAIQAGYRERAARGPRVTRHVASNILVDRLDARTASIRSILCLFAVDGVAPVHNTEVLAVADIVDHAIVEDGEWKLDRRVLTTVFMTEGGELAAPTA